MSGNQVMQCEDPGGCVIGSVPGSQVFRAGEGSVEGGPQARVFVRRGRRPGRDHAVAREAAEHREAGLEPGGGPPAGSDPVDGAGERVDPLVAGARLAQPPAPDRLAGSLSKMLAPEIAVFRAVLAPAGFSARFDAVRRTYRYRILNREFPDPLRRRIAWHVKHPLDVEGMNRAVGHLRGEHDFASFCRRAEGRSTVRTVERAVWSSRPDDMLRFEISASAFCHQMVRSITAWSVEVGRGRRSPEETPSVLAAQDRAAAAGAAPPHGLTLWQVDY